MTKICQNIDKYKIIKFFSCNFCINFLLHFICTTFQKCLANILIRGSCSFDHISVSDRMTYEQKCIIRSCYEGFGRSGHSRVTHALSRVRELTFIHKNHSILGTRFITRFVSHGTVIHVWIIDTGWKSDGYRCGWGILVEDRGQSFPFTRKEIYSWPETVSWKNFYSDRILEEFRIYFPWLNVFYPLNSW